MSHAPIDYRKPATRNLPVAPDASQSLERFESAFRTRWLMLLATGATVTLIPPVLVAIAAYFRQFFKTYNDYHGWPYFFGMWFCILVPILLILGRLLSGNLSDSAAESVDQGSRFVRIQAGRVIVIMVLLDIALWGPRMIFTALTRISGLRKHAGADRAVAARLLGILLARDDGMTTVQLMVQASAPDNAFGDALALLSYMEIIDIAKDGSRIWIQSLARQQLTATR